MEIIHSLSGINNILIDIEYQIIGLLITKTYLIVQALRGGNDRKLHEYLQTQDALVDNVYELEIEF